MLKVYQDILVGFTMPSQIKFKSIICSLLTTLVHGNKAKLGRFSCGAN